jgi:hypothetical protein
MVDLTNLYKLVNFCVYLSAMCICRAQQILSKLNGNILGVMNCEWAFIVCMHALLARANTVCLCSFA